MSDDAWEGGAVAAEGDLTLPNLNELDEQPQRIIEHFASFDDLFARYQAAIIGYIYRIVGDREQAEDLAQDAFIRAYQAWERLRPDSNVVAWLYTIATNTARNALRRRKVISWTSLNNLLPFLSSSSATSARHQPDLGGGHPGVGLGVTDPTSGTGDEELVHKALTTIQPEYRTALLLNIHEGFSIAEVAQITASSEAAVKTRLFRARKAFQEAFLRLQAADFAAEHNLAPARVVNSSEANAASRRKGN